MIHLSNILMIVFLGFCIGFGSLGSLAGIIVSGACAVMMRLMPIIMIVRPAAIIFLETDDEDEDER